ncbi:MAG: hypothetical protein K2N51_13145 [Lachnospiraceae bacterium]|nr:hypothetical protein [Lachnospiraceae bacterium]
MAKPKRTAKKTTDKTTQITTSNATTKETTTNEPVAIKPMVPRTAPLNDLTEAASAVTYPATASEEVIVQFGGKELSNKDIMERAKQAYKDNGQTDAITSVTAYVKPEENKVYFVINNDYQGSFDY